MTPKNTNDDKNHQRLFLKVFVGFCFLWAHCFQSQITISGGATVYSDNESQEVFSDLQDVDAVDENTSKVKIYVTTGASVLGLQENNFEITEVRDIKKQIASKTKITKSSKLKRTEAEPANESVAEPLQKTDDFFSSAPQSDATFCSHSHEKTVFAQTQLLSGKNFVKTDSNTIQVAAFALDSKKITLKIAYCKSNTRHHTFSVRPPPVLS